MSICVFWINFHKMKGRHLLRWKGPFRYNQRRCVFLFLCSVWFAVTSTGSEEGKMHVLLLGCFSSLRSFAGKNNVSFLFPPTVLLWKKFLERICSFCLASISFFLSQNLCWGWFWLSLIRFGCLSLPSLPLFLPASFVSSLMKEGRKKRPQMRWSIIICSRSSHSLLGRTWVENSLRSHLLSQGSMDRGWNQM